MGDSFLKVLAYLDSIGVLQDELRKGVFGGRKMFLLKII